MKHIPPPCGALVCLTKREKSESEAQRGKPKGTLESEIRIAMLLLGQRPQVGALTLRRSHCDDDDLYYYIC